MEEEYEDIIESNMSMSVDDVTDSEELNDPDVGNIVGLVKDRYNKASTSRETEEQRWIQAYRNYRGLYGSDVQFTSTEKSRVFVKVTKTKVLAAYGQIVDVLFGNNKFPITVDPTTLPEGVADSVHFETNPQMEEIDPEETKLKPGETYPELQDRLAGLKEKLKPVMDKLEEGPGTVQGQVTIHPAMLAAKKMEKKIHDQLEESNANKQAT